jgi:hypothetical protein
LATAKFNVFGDPEDTDLQLQHVRDTWPAADFVGVAGISAGSGRVLPPPFQFVLRPCSGRARAKQQTLCLLQCACDVWWPSAPCLVFLFGVYLTRFYGRASVYVCVDAAAKLPVAGRVRGFGRHVFRRLMACLSIVRDVVL